MANRDRPGRCPHFFAPSYTARMPKRCACLCCLSLVLACGGPRRSGDPVEGKTLALGAAPGPYLSPEFPVDQPNLGTGRNNYGAKAAFDGTGFLVVWRDGREALSRIYATRVDSNGKVLDPLGLRLTTTSNIQNKADIAYGDGTFLAVWEESSGSMSPKIYAARISSAGTVLDPTGFPVSGESYGDQLSPALAFDGTNFMVTWSLGGSGGRIAAARVSPAGKVLDATPLTVSKINSTYAAAQGEPAIAFDGTNYLVAWQDDRNTWWDIYANRVSPTGSVLDGNGFPVANAESGENTPALAFDGNNYLVTWSDWPGDSSRESSIYARRVSPAGTVLDSNALVVCTATGEQTQPTAMFDGSQFIVAWTDYRATPGQIFSARVSGAGQVLDPDGRALTNTEGVSYEPSLALGAGQILLTRSNNSVWGTRLDLTGTSKDGAGFPLVSAPNVETNPAVAFGTTDYLVVWVDSRLSGWNIFGARVSPQGAVLDSKGFAVSTSPIGQTDPLVAWNGTHYFVAWFGAKSAGRRVAANGTVVDATDIALPSFGPGGMASDGSGFLIVGTPSAGTNTISGYRVSAAGALLDATPFTISTAEGSRSNPRVTFDGSNYLVVWRDSRAGSYRPYAARVSSAGAVVDADGFALADATVALSPYSPEVASDGTGSSLAVWVDSRSYAVAGARISGDSVADPAGIVIQARPSTSDLLNAPRVVFDGTNFVVGFVDEKLDSNYHVVSYTLKTARVSPQGAVLSGLQVATHPSEDIPVQVASDRAGGSLFAYELPDTAWGFPVPRVRARIFFENPPTDACRTPADCASGFCVDGVCCDGACGGGVPTDCLACSKAAGSSADGTCGPVVDGYGCSDSNACTVSDTCTQGACAGILSTSVPGKTCSGSLDAGRPDGPRDAARSDAGVIRLDGAGLVPDLGGDGSATVVDGRADSARGADATTLSPDAASAVDVAPATTADARPADSQALSRDATASSADAGLPSSIDAPATKKSPSGCSCNQGRAPSGTLWSIVLALPLIASTRVRRRNRRR
jgi:hypothetical protein